MREKEFREHEPYRSKLGWRSSFGRRGGGEYPMSNPAKLRLWIIVTGVALGLFGRALLALWHTAAP